MTGCVTDKKMVHGFGSVLLLERFIQSCVVNHVSDSPFHFEPLPFLIAFAFEMAVFSMLFDL